VENPARDPREVENLARVTEDTRMADLTVVAMDPTATVVVVEESRANPREAREVIPQMEDITTVK
jgi:adenylate kinase